jgi:sulfhydrogenase subunit gamma (sulfur reductase)
MIYPVRITGRGTETADIYTFTMRFVDHEVQRAYSFKAGQFNMLYAFGAGEVPISIVSDPGDHENLEHTIRIAGRVTGVMAEWKVGEVVGVRGPYGNGWPVEEARGRDAVIITGGLGCAPVVGLINYIFRRRDQYGDLHILHGVRTPNDLLYRERFDEWRRAPRTRVYLTADQPDKSWHYKIGVVTELFDELTVPSSSIVMMCGPEEVLYAIDEAVRVIDAYQPPPVPAASFRVRSGVGRAITEAPRGSLYHAFETDERGLIHSARIVPPTSQNQARIEADLRELVPDLVQRSQAEATHMCEIAIRNYDPCISCSTHFLKLEIERH